MGTRARSCEGKVAYQDEEAANASIAQRVADGVAPGLLNSYRCRFGDHYHIGHKSRRIRRNAMRAR